MPNPTVLAGSPLADRLNGETKVRAADVLAQRGTPPTLATVLIGNDPASVSYVRMKQRRCRECGLRTVHRQLPESITTPEAVREIEDLSHNPEIDGILVQHPMGLHIDERSVFDAIAPAKDVDGVTSTSAAAMIEGRSRFLACTPGGVLRLLDHYGVSVGGKDVVVVGRSAILGRPMASLLDRRNATVTVCHSHSRDLPEHVARAELVVAAVGQPDLIQGDWLQHGAVVVDTGYHPGGRGDVHQASARARASAITPVPGGVGPMTVATLLSQTVDASWPQVH